MSAHMQKKDYEETGKAIEETHDITLTGLIRRTNGLYHTSGRQNKLGGAGSCCGDGSGGKGCSGGGRNFRGNGG